ncbi:ATP-binding protein [Marinobacterium litorale]|uniref:ATP-binding protein n=1 Tax=Marinobacterium litorale TaxID=404770 RepID=UPI00040B158C|nr:ATP-binding protein [Marinobacterium litorale]
MDEVERKLGLISESLSPERPIRSTEYLLGRIESFEQICRELNHFHGIPFVYGYRGVGKTSLSTTAAQIVTPSDREYVYVACAPGSRMLDIFREIGEKLIELAIKLGVGYTTDARYSVKISLSPELAASFESKSPKLPRFENSNAAVRVLKSLDEIIPVASKTVIVLDELEELDDGDRTDLAYLIKQIGDQNFNLKFVLVGIAENVHELIGAHESVPRYIKEVYLEPLRPEFLMEIVKNAADMIQVDIHQQILYRIAIIGNGYPHFAHLIGKAILVEAALEGSNIVDDNIYQKGITTAVADSFQELRVSYEAATQRGADHYKYLVWALAHSDVVDVRIDDWIDLYKELAKMYNFHVEDDSKLKTAINNLKNVSCGEIIENTPARYGGVEKRYRYKRFSSTLMRGHVRLQAEKEGYKLGRETGL